jgi:hypothetical protein
VVAFTVVYGALAVADVFLLARFARGSEDKPVELGEEMPVPVGAY